VLRVGVSSRPGVGRGLSLDRDTEPQDARAEPNVVGVGQPDEALVDHLPSVIESSLCKGELDQAASEVAAERGIFQRRGRDAPDLVQHLPLGEPPSPDRDDPGEDPVPAPADSALELGRHPREERGGFAQSAERQ
jgi:hypothetical protein